MTLTLKIQRLLRDVFGRSQCIYYTNSDKGCWVDGTLGQEHAVDKLVVMLGAIRKSLIKAKRLEEAASLEHLINDPKEEDEDTNWLDWADEWMDKATDMLAQYTAEGLMWEWEAGDLTLRRVE